MSNSFVFDIAALSIPACRRLATALADTSGRGV